MSSTPEPHAPESQDPDDLLIASEHLNGRYPWRNSAQQVPYGRVLLIAAKLKWSPATVVTRLYVLGYGDVQRSEGPLPDVVEPDDAPLITGVQARFGAHPLDIDKTVSLRQTVESAARANRSPADVARRLTALGYRVGTGARPLPETADPRDIALIRTDARSYGTWLDWGDEVSASHVLGVAEDLSCSPRVAAERLIALGLRLPYTPEPGDERLLKYRDRAGAAGSAAGRPHPPDTSSPSPGTRAARTRTSWPGWASWAAGGRTGSYPTPWRRTTSSSSARTWTAARPG